MGGTSVPPNNKFGNVEIISYIEHKKYYEELENICIERLQHS
jgi:hypothetical protein